MDVTQLKTTINSLSGQTTKFSDNFWKFIKEEVGIHYIYPQQKSYVKKKNSFEERQAKID